MQRHQWGKESTGSMNRHAVFIGTGCCDSVDEDHAYFPPSSIIRKVSKEALGLVGGGRAVQVLP